MTDLNKEALEAAAEASFKGGWDRLHEDYKETWRNLIARGVSAYLTAAPAPAGEAAKAIQRLEQIADKSSDGGLVSAALETADLLRRIIANSAAPAPAGEPKPDYAAQRASLAYTESETPRNRKVWYPIPAPTPAGEVEEMAKRWLAYAVKWNEPASSGAPAIETADMLRALARERDEAVKALEALKRSVDTGRMLGWDADQFGKAADFIDAVLSRLVKKEDRT
jgi:hypothetical protein